MLDIQMGGYAKRMYKRELDLNGFMHLLNLTLNDTVIKIDYSKLLHETYMAIAKQEDAIG